MGLKITDLGREDFCYIQRLCCMVCRRVFRQIRQSLCRIPWHETLQIYYPAYQMVLAFYCLMVKLLGLEPDAWEIVSLSMIRSKETVLQDDNCKHADLSTDILLTANKHCLKTSQFTISKRPNYLKTSQLTVSNRPNYLKTSQLTISEQPNYFKMSQQSQNVQLSDVESCRKLWIFEKIAENFNSCGKLREKSCGKWQKLRYRNYIVPLHINWFRTMIKQSR